MTRGLQCMGGILSVARRALTFLGMAVGVNSVVRSRAMA
jgi:hypothetical protein